MSGRTMSILILTIFIAPILFGQSSETHDGFYMRFLLGGSSSTMKLDGGSTDMVISGISGTFRFQIGSEIGKNLIAYGEVGGITISNPEIKIGGKTYDTKDIKASSFDLGGGISYYFMPTNIYITGSILASRARFEYSGSSTTQKGESDVGFGLFFGAGKEWWISNDWALGATLFAAYSSVPDKGNSDITISNTTFGVAFSATFQ